MLDGQAFVAYTHQAAPDLPVILIGHSLGAAVAPHCRATLPAAGLITVVAFSSLAAMVPASPHLSLPERFDNLALAPRIRVPWVLLHSRAEDIIPFAPGQALASAAVSDPRVTFMTVDAIGHNDPERVLPEALARHAALSHATASR
jgi:pimeloyl-ACP methyl ester carboxylesterase